MLDSPKLTARQQQILDLIQSAISRTGAPPTRAEIKKELSLLDKLIEESRCYKKGRDYMELLKFVAKLPNMAPFNAMLVQLQKPGIAYAASAAEWRR